MSRIHSADQAAEIIGNGCKASWLKEQARLRQIPFTMPGGRYGWTDAHIDEIIKMFEHRPEPRTPGRPRPRQAAPAAPAPAVTQLRGRVPKRLAALTQVPA
jgi:hypothetical protein